MRHDLGGHLRRAGVGGGAHALGANRDTNVNRPGDDLVGYVLYREQPGGAEPVGNRCGGRDGESSGENGGTHNIGLARSKDVADADILYQVGVDV